MVIEERGTIKSKHTRFFGRVLHGVVLIVALCAFIPFLAGLVFGVYGAKWAAATMIFTLASLLLMAMIPRPGTLPAINSELTGRQLRLPDWSFLSYCAIVGLGFNWVCTFLWFSGRYAFFSTPVIGVTSLIMAFYAGIAILVARVTRGNWRAAVAVFAFAPGVLAGIALRLGLLR